MRGRLRRPLGSSLAAGVLVALAGAGACNAVNGTGDLTIGSGNTPDAFDARAPGEDLHDGDTASSDAGDPTGDGSVPPSDASVADGGCTSPALSPTMTIGSAKAITTGYYELTANTNGLAGGLLAPTMQVLDDFDAQLQYSITVSNGNTPGAGVIFFAIASSPNKLSCRPGPYLCTLDAPDPGFAVMLRTSKAVGTDPEVPYLAVVDAKSYPNNVPTNPLLVNQSLAWTNVQMAALGVPPATTFHTMAIAKRKALISVALDGQTLLTNVAVPGFVAGTKYTWGVAAATGEGQTFAERNVVGPVTLRMCP